MYILHVKLKDMLVIFLCRIFIESLLNLPRILLFSNYKTENYFKTLSTHFFSFFYIYIFFFIFFFLLSRFVCTFHFPLLFSTFFFIRLFLQKSIRDTLIFLLCNALFLNFPSLSFHFIIFT